eukprot:3681955-Amphidinium_carterae.1
MVKEDANSNSKQSWSSANKNVALAAHQTQDASLSSNGWLWGLNTEEPARLDRPATRHHKPM